jgi:hypothetical protein
MALERLGMRAKPRSDAGHLLANKQQADRIAKRRLLRQAQQGASASAASIAAGTAAT